jgi:hypothetical protein
MGNLFKYFYLLPMQSSQHKHIHMRQPRMAEVSGMQEHFTGQKKDGPKARQIITKRIKLVKN